MKKYPTILVTGASGLLGKHIVRTLTDQKLGRVIGVSRRPILDVYADVKYVHVDLFDYHQVKKLREFDPDIVVHTAAILPSSFNDELASGINESIDRHVLQLATEAGARLLFFSSISVYENSPLPWTESSLIHASSPYACAKRNTEKILSQLDISSAILRISSPYSAVDPARGGVLFHFVRQACAGKVLEVSGRGLRAQDFVHAHDVGRAVVSIISYWETAASPSKDIFNIASGRVVPMRVLADTIVRLNGAGNVVVGKEDNEDDLYRAEVSVRWAEEKLNWKPTVSLDTGLSQLIRRMRGAHEDWLAV